MQNVYEKKFTIWYVKSPSERLKIVEKYPIFRFLNCSYTFSVKRLSNSVIQERLDPVSNKRFQKDICIFLEKFLK